MAFYRIYQPRKFADASKIVVVHAKAIIDEYDAAGFDLTLRQLYYQFVARDVFPEDRWWRRIEETNKWVRAAPNSPGATKNADPNYKWLGSIINDARMAGLLDWNRIEDRTRELEEKPEWDSPEQLIEVAAREFHIDLWEGQEWRPEVWIEKDALVGVIDGVCKDNDVDYFACRGYVSQSEMWRAGRRIGKYLANGQKVVILHLGDHDPSGIDMTRDIEERILRFLLVDRWNDVVEGDSDEDWQENSSFVLDHFKVERIALNMDQIEAFNPPPNPAKLSDARGSRYVEEYGFDSWELDALDPQTMAEIIERGIEEHRDEEQYEEQRADMERQRLALTAAATRWDEVTSMLEADSE
jgi:hypothetical protein